MYFLVADGITTMWWCSDSFRFRAYVWMLVISWRRRCWNSACVMPTAISLERSRCGCVQGVGCPRHGGRLCWTLADVTAVTGDVDSVLVNRAGVTWIAAAITDLIFNWRKSCCCCCCWFTSGLHGLCCPCEQPSHGMAIAELIENHFSVFVIC